MHDIPNITHVPLPRSSFHRRPQISANGCQAEVNNEQCACGEQCECIAEWRDCIAGIVRGGGTNVVIC